MELADLRLILLFPMVWQKDSIVINAPPRDVFAYVHEPTKLPEWMDTVVDIRRVVGSGEGGQYDWTIKMLGVQLRGQNVIVEYVQDEHATHQSIGMLSSEWTASVEAAEGGTKLTFEAEYTIPIPVLGKFAEGLTVRRHERLIRSMLLNIKDVLES